MFVRDGCRGTFRCGLHQAVTWCGGWRRVTFACACTPAAPSKLLDRNDDAGRQRRPSPTPSSATARGINDSLSAADIVCNAGARPLLRVGICFYGPGVSLHAPRLRSGFVAALGGNATIVVALSGSTDRKAWMDVLGVSSAISDDGCGRRVCHQVLHSHKSLGTEMAVVVEVRRVPMEVLRPHCFYTALKNSLAPPLPDGVEMYGTSTGWLSPADIQACTSATATDQRASANELTHGCSADSLAPRVAFCLSGHARTFAHPLAHRTIIQHFVDGYGGRSTLFAYLKLHDETATRAQHTRVHASKAHLYEALAAMRVPLENTRVVAGDRASLSFPRCNVTPTFSNKHASYRQSNYHAILGQLDNRKVCYDMITHHEMWRGVRFDHVFVIRPDMIFPFMVPPHCSAAWHHEAVGCRYDFAYSIPRRFLEKALELPFTRVYGCEAHWTDWSEAASLMSKHAPLGPRSPEEYTWAFFRSAGVPCSEHVAGPPATLLRPLLSGAAAALHTQRCRQDGRVILDFGARHDPTRSARDDVENWANRTSTWVRFCAAWTSLQSVVNATPSSVIEPTT